MQDLGPEVKNNLMTKIKKLGESIPDTRLDHEVGLQTRDQYPVLKTAFRAVSSLENRFAHNFRWLP